MRRILGLMAALWLTACGGLKQLPEGELLYRGTEISLESEHHIENAAALRAELADVVSPKPNTRLLWRYPGLYIHQRAQREKGAKLAKKLNKRYGEAPVYLSAIQTERMQSLMQNRLENRGYFEHRVQFSVEKKRKTAHVQVQVHLGEPYRLAEYSWLGPNDSLARLLQPQLAQSAWKPGKRYDLVDFRTERERLDRWLKNRGYYAFSPDYFIFRVDTNLGNRRFNLYLGLKSETPEAAVQAYRLGQVRVYPNHLIESDSARLQQSDTSLQAGVYFIEGQQTTFLPRHLRRYILMQPGELYVRQRELTTSNRLSSLGTFRFVNLRYQLPPATTTTQPTLDVDIYLSPANKRRLRYETQFLSKSNNFVGPALKVGYQNRNLFKGGELLNVDANFGFETQFAGGRQTGLNAFEVGLKSELVFPRVIAPFPLGDEISYGLANTRILMGASVLNRVQFYRLLALQSGYGYQWRTNRFVTHDWQPLSVSFTRLSRTSPEFEAILESNPFLRESFDQRFIAGMVYHFTYSEQAEPKTHRWVLLASLDASGNLPGLLSSNNQLFGEPLAQFVRLDADLRHHWVFSTDRRLVFRAFAGYGYSYGNSRTLPFIKQYFAGGPNSVRGFNIRSLGPGAYRPPTFDVASFFDQAGDIKIEGNLEYRFPLFPYVKGAYFLDAGNIWLQRFNPALGGGQFSANWLNELGVGAGFGMRIDLDLLVFRFDLGTPLRKPWLAAGDRWLNSFSLNSRTWRRENLNLVFAIGYPF